MSAQRFHPDSNRKPSGRLSSVVMPWLKFLRGWAFPVTASKNG